MDYKEIEKLVRKERKMSWVKDTRKKLMKTATRYEWKVYKALPEWLKKNAVRQRKFQHQGHTFFFDIYLPCAKAAIEVDGGYHMSQKEKDSLRDQVVSLYGIKTFRITNEHVLSAYHLRKFIEDIEFYALVYKARKGSRK